ncbi:MAG: hypothetical protein J7K15_06750 [Deltaproteobacteria bacterium]|nr:hypothetical protein [Deltaproteobacteria bacterium]
MRHGSEVRRRKDGGRKAEDGGQRTGKDRGQKAEVGSEKMELIGCK